MSDLLELITPASERWQLLLNEALRRNNGNKQAVADELLVSRTLVSLVVNRKYMRDTGPFIRRVYATYDKVDCPHLNEKLSKATCQTYADREAPTSSPREMRHWRSCQLCPHRPLGGKP